MAKAKKPAADPDRVPMTKNIGARVVVEFPNDRRLELWIPKQEMGSVEMIAGFLGARLAHAIAREAGVED